jgi:hypothetical protein
MTKPTKIVVNCETGVQEEIELTNAEIAQIEADRIAYQQEMTKRENEEKALANLKASAKAKLVAGKPLTAEEADTLII